MTPTPETRAAAARAADWLEANPDKHVQSFLACDENGHLVDPVDPAANCFCALGRFAKEANIPSPRFTYYPYARVLGDEPMDAIWVRNDIDKADGIRALREVADG